MRIENATYNDLKEAFGPAASTAIDKIGRYSGGYGTWNAEITITESGRKSAVIIPEHTDGWYIALSGDTRRSRRVAR